jgi:hypothetical protein
MILRTSSIVLFSRHHKRVSFARWGSQSREVAHLGVGFFDIAASAIFTSSSSSPARPPQLDAADEGDSAFSGCSNTRSTVLDAEDMPSVLVELELGDELRGPFAGRWSMAASNRPSTPEGFGHAAPSSDLMLCCRP